MERQITSLNELNVFASEFVKTLNQQAHEATVVALFGELGSGKTSFTQATARALGVLEQVTSPTFVIEKIYKLKQQAFLHLIHIDAYRLEDSHELVALGWEDLIREPSNLVFVEWADRIKDILPNTAVKLSFTYINETTRSVTMSR